MTDDHYEEILGEVIEAGRTGRVPAFDELLALHPGQEHSVRRALNSFREYEQLRAQATESRRTGVGALAPGDRLGDFQIDAPLGRGGMGVVYRARQISLGGRMVALKVLATESAGKHGAARFRREAQQLADLHPSNLAAVYGTWEERGTLYFAMQLVEGPTLRDVLEQRATERAVRNDPASRRLIVERIAEVADALALAHSRGLVHRDVKPSNIVLEKIDGGRALAGRAVLVDFGLARPIEAHTLTQTGESPATPSYAPPEQLLGQDVDARADVFSLGVTLHDLLAARRPTERMQASASLEPLRELVPEVDEDLAAVVARAVDPEARWRYANATELRDDLRAWLVGDPVSARSLPWSERARRWLARHPRRIAQVALLVAAIVLMSVGFSLGPGAQLRSASDVRAAVERGDLWELGRASHELAGWMPVGWMFSNEQASAVERVRGAESDDLLVQALAALDSNDMGGALFAAATAIGARGAPEDPMLERFFVACETDAALHVRLRPEHVDAWALLLGRAMYENPIEEPTRAARLRAAVLHAWAREDLSATARAYLLTALGGVGTIDDLLDPMLAWVAEPARTWEEVRSGGRNIERIVLRTHAGGDARALPFDALWRAIEPMALRLRDAPQDARPFAVVPVVVDLCTSLVLAERAAGIEPRFRDEYLPRPAWREFPNGPVQVIAAWAPLLAACGEPRLERALSDLASPLYGRLAGKDLGRVAALLPAVAEVRKAVEIVAGAADEDMRRSFEEGRSLGLAELAGLMPEEELDADTLFGYRFPDASLRAIEGRRAEPGVLLDFTLTTRSLANLREDLGWWTLRGEAEGGWWFSEGETRWFGSASQPLGIAAPVKSDGPMKFLALPTFGVSAVRFPFRIDAATAGLERGLMAFLQRNARNYYPELGHTAIELTLNDAPLEISHTVLIHTRPSLIALPTAALRVGENTIRVRILETSTAPLRIHELGIVQIN